MLKSLNFIISITHLSVFHEVNRLISCWENVWKNPQIWPNIVCLLVIVSSKNISPLKHTHTHTHTVEFSLQVKQLHSAAPPDRYCNLECSWSVWCILFISLQILKNKGTPGWNLIKLVIFSVLSRVFLRKTEFLLFWDCADEAYNDSPPPAQDSLVPPPWSMAPAVLPTFVFCNINANINTVKKANNASAQL